MNKKNIWACLSIVICFYLSACGGIKTTASSDAALNKQIDISKISNAVPKYEPKSRSGNPKSYVVSGKRYHVMASSVGFVEKGIASWYGTKFHGRRTSSGETYDMYKMTAAHKNLPLPTYVKVTNLNNGKYVIVRVNDRGPFHDNRIIDLSYAAAVKLDIVKKGTGLVEVRAIQPGESIMTGSNEGAPVKTGSSYNNNEGFYIQVGSFEQWANAETLRKRLSPLGRNLIKISRVIVGGKTLYRVRIGPLTDIELSDSITGQLKKYGISEHRIVIN